MLMPHLHLAVLTTKNGYMIYWRICISTKN